jgi:hypothetical protein
LLTPHNPYSLHSPLLSPWWCQWTCCHYCCNQFTEAKRSLNPPLHSFCKDLLSVRKPVRKIQEMEISRVLRFEGGRREQHTEFRASIDLRWGTRREDACTPVMISCSCCSHRRRCLQVLISASCSSCKVQLPTGSCLWCLLCEQ